MPSAAPFEAPTLAPAKKRQREDDPIDVQMGLTYRYKTLPQNLPLPVTKRFRVVNEHHPEGYQIPSQLSQQPQPQPFHHAHPEYSKPSVAPQVSQTITSAKSMTSAPALLSPCHICHRKPTKRSDLESFADCMGCGQRACFICIRACQGWLPPGLPTEANWDAQVAESFTMKDADDDDYYGYDYDGPDYQEEHQLADEQQGASGGGEEQVGGWTGRGHRDMICSRCCVERGSYGDVVCLGCLAWMEGT